MAKCWCWCGVGEAFGEVVYNNSTDEVCWCSENWEAVRKSVGTARNPETRGDESRKAEGRGQDMPRLDLRSDTRTTAGLDASSRPATSHPSARIEGSRRGTWPIVPTTRVDPAVRKVGEGCAPAGRLDPVKSRVLEVGVAVKQHRGAQGPSQCTYPWSRGESNGRRKGAQVHM